MNPLKLAIEKLVSRFFAIQNFFELKWKPTNFTLFFSLFFIQKTLFLTFWNKISFTPITQRRLRPGLLIRLGLSDFDLTWTHFFMIFRIFRTFTETEWALQTCLRFTSMLQWLRCWSIATNRLATLSNWDLFWQKKFFIYIRPL